MSDILVIVDPEKVRVQNGLQDPRKNGDGVPMAFRKVPVEPIEDVECSISAQSKEIVCGDCFGFAGSLEHE